MFLFLLSFLGSCKICRAVLVAGAAALALLSLVGYEKHKAATEARAAVIAEQEKLTAAESERRQKVINDARNRAELAVGRLSMAQRRNAALQMEIARLSARNDSRACLDADSVRRLREIGQPISRGVAGG